MDLFLATVLDARQAELHAAEVRHCTQVLRKGPGDQILVTEGKGVAYRARIIQTSRETVHVELVETLPEFGEPHKETMLVFGLLKNRERMETLLEKAVELGVTRILPVQCHRSERGHWNAERAEKLLFAALKQSQRSRLPRLDPVMDFEKALRLAQLMPVRLIADIATEEPPTSSDLSAEGVSLVVGPEGDFSPGEMAFAEAADFKRISLGQTRLRAETAALHLLSIRKFAAGF